MMPVASSEFIALCQAQILLLSQALGASSTVVYLAETSGDAADLSLVPLVAYPETVDPWLGLAESLTLLTEQNTEQNPEEVAAGSVGVGSSEVSTSPKNNPPEGRSDLARAQRLFPQPGPAAVNSAYPGRSRRNAPPSPLPPLVLPLVHEGVALGMIVSTRSSPLWSHEDRHQAEQVANTLALAWVLDQRGQWLQQQLHQRHLTQANQSETFHDLLHQFRNPLTALQTFGRLLVKRIPADDPNQPIAEGIVRESRRLQDLATTFDQAVSQGDDLLQADPRVPPVAKLLLPGSESPQPGAGSLPGQNGQAADSPGQALSPDPGDTQPLGRHLEVRPGSLVDVAAPLLATAAAIAQDRGLAMVQTLPPDLPPVWMDPVALAEVLSNLLDNALKYAPPGSLLWVTGGLTKTLQGKPLQGIAIGDTGHGIPLADQAHIFERHFRGVQAQGDIPGTGLGLAIAWELVQAMGGYIELVSPAPVEQWVTGANPEVQRGPGTLFMVWLPTV